MSVLLASVALVLILGWVLVGVTLDRRRERTRLEKPAEPPPPPLKSQRPDKAVPKKYLGRSAPALLGAECIDPPDISETGSVHEFDIACSIDVYIQEEIPGSQKYKVIIVRHTAIATRVAEISLESPQGPDHKSKLAEALDDASSKALLDRSGLWEQTMAGWVTDSSMELADAANFVGNLNVKVHELVEGKPVTLVADLMGFEKEPAEAFGVVLSEYPLPWDGTVARAKRFLQFTGMALSVATHGPLLSCACFKWWAHDQARDLIAEAAQDYFGGPEEEFSDPVNRETEAHRERLHKTFELDTPHDLPDNPNEDDSPHEGTGSL